MPLTPGEVATISNLVTREGGIGELIEAYRDSLIGTKRTTVIATLAPAITVTVQDWQALQNFVSRTDMKETVPSVMTAIASAAQARNASQLGPLFVALYAGVRSGSSS